VSSDIKDPPSLLIFPLSHFFILPTSLSCTHRRPLSFTLAPTDYCVFAFSPTHSPFHSTGDAARSDSLDVLTGVGCNAIQSLRSRITGVAELSTASHDCVSILHFLKNSTKTLDRFLSAGQVFPLGVCYFADLPGCEVYRIAFLDAVCSALSALS
jgi:hypothetical protein